MSEISRLKITHVIGLGVPRYKPHNVFKPVTGGRSRRFGQNPPLQEGGFVQSSVNFFFTFIIIYTNLFSIHSGKDSICSVTNGSHLESVVIIIINLHV